MPSKRSSCCCVFYDYQEYSLPKEKKQEKKKEKEKKKIIHKAVPKTPLLLQQLTNQEKLTTAYPPHEIKRHFYFCDNHYDLVVKHHNIHAMYSSPFHKTENSILLEFEDRPFYSFENYLKDAKTATKYLSSILEAYRQLLQSIQLLLDQHLCFHHIQLDTILVDMSDNVVLCDFSHSLDFSPTRRPWQIDDMMIPSTFSPARMEWPIEFHLLSYMRANQVSTLSLENVETVTAECLQHHPILRTFGPSITETYRTEAVQYFRKYVNQPVDWVLSDMVQYAPTWDNYALSILFLRILIGVHRTIATKNKFIVLFMKLLVTNIHFHPEKRFSVEATRDELDTAVLNRVNAKDYQEVIALMTAAVSA
jgi:hypothetical protein